MCRAPCFQALTTASLATRMEHFLRALPTPAGVSFHLYVLAIARSRNPLTEALRLTDEERQWVLDLVWQSFTPEHFVENLRVLFG